VASLHEYSETFGSNSFAEIRLHTVVRFWSQKTAYITTPQFIFLIASISFDRIGRFSQDFRRDFLGLLTEPHDEWHISKQREIIYNKGTV
jgi:hypothetical protein